MPSVYSNWVTWVAEDDLEDSAEQPESVYEGEPFLASQVAATESAGGGRN